MEDHWTKPRTTGSAGSPLHQLSNGALASARCSLELLTAARSSVRSPHVLTLPIGERQALRGRLSPSARLADATTVCLPALVDRSMAEAIVAPAVAEAFVGTLEHLVDVRIDTEDPEFEARASSIEHQHDHSTLPERDGA